MDQAEFEKRAVSYIKIPDNDPEFLTSLETFKKSLSYLAGDYADGAAFDALRNHLENIESSYGPGEVNRIFYLALPPSVFIPVAKNIKEHCYNDKDGINRLIIEKPFGKDTESSRELLSAVKKYWTEEETFRIDHYLGKEMVKNLLVLRFANVAMGAAWDKNSISNVQITFKEPFGTEGRGGYFDEFGIIRDILQNRMCISFAHIDNVINRSISRPFASPEYLDDGTTRIFFCRGHPRRKSLSLHSLSMTPMTNLTQVKVLRSIPPIERKDTLLGQYVAANGKPGYLDDDTVPANSSCPTFAATTLWIHNPRWEGVPFILKAGKGLSTRIDGNSNTEYS